jgi:hypothetical protein
MGVPLGVAKTLKIKVNNIDVLQFLILFLFKIDDVILILCTIIDVVDLVTEMLKISHILERIF